MASRLFRCQSALTSWLLVLLLPFGSTRSLVPETSIQSPIPAFFSRWLRLMMVLALTVCGIGMLSLASPTHQHALAPAVAHPSSVAQMTQAGGLQETPTCTIGDIGCYANALATYATEAVWNVIKPLVDLIVTNPLNFVNQTSPLATYQNSQVRLLVQWELGVVDSALVVFLGFLAYNLIIGHSIGMNLPSFQEALPRIIVAFLAAHLSLYLCQLLIDFNNALCHDVYDAFLKTYLKDTIANMIAFGESGMDGAAATIFGYLLRMWLIVFFFIQLLWLAWQMLVRLAMVALLTALSPLGLMCLALPQTQRWGQIWLSALSTTVMMQFFQITALSLGGLLTSYAVSIVPSGQSDMVTTFLEQILSLLMAGAVFYLVPRLPHTLQSFALRPILLAQRSQEIVVQRTVHTVTREATQMLKRAIATS